MSDEIEVTSGTFQSVTATATMRAPVMRCPVCKSTDSNDSPFASFGRIPRISVSIKPFEGEYCQTCYANWLSENIPKLVRVPLESTP